MNFVYIRCTKMKKKRLCCEKILVYAKVNFSIKQFTQFEHVLFSNTNISNSVDTLIEQHRFILLERTLLKISVDVRVNFVSI